jgi:hypothetical protein
VILEITAAGLVAGIESAGGKVTDRAAMLKYFAEHLTTDENAGEDLKINSVLDEIASDAIESAEPWCELAEESE